MTNKSLLALKARLEAATGSSRELDAFIEDEIGVSSEYPGSHLSVGYKSRHAYLAATSPRYTASLDAAVALVERVFGKDLLAWDVGYAYNGGPYSGRIFLVYGAELSQAEAHESHPASAPLALLLALARALIAKAQQENPE